MNKIFYLLLLTLLSDVLQAQDSLKSIKELDLGDVVVTATRTEKTRAALPMLVTVVTKEQIKSMGSLRLNEVLQEQTGLAVVTEHGQGVQMQGFNPDYTLILIDGEPIIGRTAGTLELSRLAVGNIQQIEIVKGPSSSLYGSEALAGVINIITKKPINSTHKTNLQTRYGTNQTLDLSVNNEYQHQKFGIYTFLNRYSTAGYDFSPNSYGQTIEPFQNYTLQTKLHYDFSNTLKATLSGRFFRENQQSRYQFAADSINGKGRQQDYNLNASLQYQASEKWKNQLRFYFSEYQTENKDVAKSNETVFDENYFIQQFLRPELQSDYHFSDKHNVTFGVGATLESVEATRYTAKKRFNSQYAYVQYEWQPTEKWDIIAGGRLDRHSVYGTQLNPKLSLQYQINPKIALRASAGRGFKAPDFRQIYLNFDNAAVGYSVFGTEEIAAAIQRLQAQGQLAELLIDPSQIGVIKAESSVAYNLGLKWQANEKVKGNLSFFRNDIKDLIETQAVARKNNGQNVFSYRNLQSVFTQGIETDVNYTFSKKLTFSVGYQYLEAKDKQVVAQIEKGEIFRRDPQTLETKRVSISEYGGLANRSRHSGNLKLFYNDKEKGVSATFRTVYRGKYGFADRNGNLIIDTDNEYVKGYATLHLSAAKEWQKLKNLRLQAGVDNLLNQTDKEQIPNLAGRLLWASVGVTF